MIHLVRIPSLDDILNLFYLVKPALIRNASEGLEIDD
jgi:hypothetical protein